MAKFIQVTQFETGENECALNVDHIVSIFTTETGKAAVKLTDGTALQLTKTVDEILDQIDFVQDETAE